MAMLNFKYGLHGNLPEYSQSTLGTVFVTSDEKAMYVDLPNTSVAGGVERLRLGQTIVYPTWDAFNKEETLPPSSPEAFYYIEDDNALLKYVGGSKNDDGSWSGGEWKQVNSVSDLQADIQELEKNVSTLLEYKETSSKAIGDLQAADIGLGTRIDDEETRAKAEEARIVGLVEAEAERASGAESLLSEELNTKATIVALEAEVSRATEAEKELEQAIQTNHSNLDGRVTTLESVVGNDEAGLVKAVADLNSLTSNHDSDIGNLKTAVGDSTKGLVKDVADLKITVGDSGSGLVKDVSDLETNITNIANGEINLGTRVKALEGDNSINKDDIGKLKAADITINGRIAGVDGRTTALETTVGDSTKGLVKDVADLKTTVGDSTTGLVKNVADLNSLVSGLSTNSATKAELSEVDERLSGEIDTLEGVVGNASSGLVKQVIDLETKVGNEVVEDGSLSANINTIKGNISAINEGITSLQTNKADKTYVDSQITEKLAEVDGMKFKGAINALVSDEANNKIGLPTTGVEAGWTYIVESDFAVGEGVSAESYYAGDLIIAKQDQPADVAEYNGGWEHVKTGYWKEQDPTLKYVSATTGGKQAATIYLEDIVGTSRGEVTIIGNGVEVEADASGINITLAWGQF